MLCTPHAHRALPVTCLSGPRAHPKLHSIPLSTTLLSTLLYFCDMSVFICPPQTPGYCVAYVGNIAFEATEADLRAVFEGLAVARVRMHTDAASGCFKGYAHVHFSDEASLDSCAPGPPESAVTAFALDRTEAIGYYANIAGGGKLLAWWITAKS